MPENREPYQPYIREQARAEAELRRVLREAAIDAARRITALGPGIGAQVRAAQLGLVIDQIRHDHHDLWIKEILPIIEKYYPRVEAVADAASETIRDALVNAVGETAAESLIQSSEAISGARMLTDRARRARELSQRVYRNAELMSGRIERLIRVGIVQGLSAKELARSVRDFIRPDVKGGTAYAAMRLARTELNNAFHEQQKQVMEDKPWVNGADWNLSRSHPHKDRCDELAEEGPYPAGEVPDKPHPQCLCYLTYDMISDSAMVDLLVADIKAG